MVRDDELCDYLSRSGVKWTPLDESSSEAAERAWREIYGQAFVGRPRLRQGARAEHEYQQEKCSCFLIVPFTSKIDGLPIHIVGRSMGAYDCCGPLVSLAAFHDAEFFVCPTDLSWTTVHTHEDYGHGGPFFFRQDWLT
jgi:hypothetical protein